MRFGAASLDDARGAIMAHSQRVGDRVIRKGSLLDEAALTRHAAQHLAEYKRPHRYVITREPLPRTRNGKVLRRVIIEQLQDGAR